MAMGFDITGEGKVPEKGSGQAGDDAMDMEEDSDDEGVKKQKDGEDGGLFRPEPVIGDLAFDSSTARTDVLRSISWCRDETRYK